MKAMEYCDGCKLNRMAVDCYQRESHEFCGVILLIAVTSAFVFFLVETIIDVATNGINGV